jgi:alpha-amylase
MPAFNGTIMQYFHWDYPFDRSLWRRVAEEAPALAQAGITALWLPPPSKAFEPSNPGYAIYDLWDLGEFDQKGAVPTKYGTCAELEAAIAASHTAGLQLYLDVVFNHKAGADATERVRGIPVNPDNRNQDIGPEREIEAWTVFRFDGRGGRYSTMQWTHDQFDSVDYDNLTQQRQIFRICERQFETVISPDMGNYDFLMFADVNSSVPEVREEFRAWGEWMVGTIGFDGFRIDAAKHIRAQLFIDWLAAMDARFPERQLFAVGEYFDESLQELGSYIDALGGRMSLFDFPLHFNFRSASDSGGNYDMRDLLNGTLMANRPVQACTFVDNHDTAREHTVQEWFKPLAYAVILLREQGYPCLFYLDYYGGQGRAGHRAILDQLLAVRRDHAFGPQQDYFDDANVVGWTRFGDADHPRALAVIMSDGPGGAKRMFVDRRNAGFRDATGAIGDVVTTDGDGFGEFRCNGGSVSVWLQD